MKTTIDLADIKNRLYERLKRSGWHNKLKAFLLSSEFDAIIEYLADQVEKGNRFTPPLRYLLRSFEECPYGMLKVVMIGDYPYSRIGVCDGIGLSCSLTKREEPALKAVFDTLEQHTEETYNRDTDLGRWSRQGILMINTALTCQLDRPSSHTSIWLPFTSFLFDMLNYENRGLVFVFMGTEAGKFSDLIGEQHYKIHVPHPAINSPDGRTWNQLTLFSSIDRIMRENYQTDIQW